MRHKYTIREFQWEFPSDDCKLQSSTFFAKLKASSLQKESLGLLINHTDPHGPSPAAASFQVMEGWPSG